MLYKLYVLTVLLVVTLWSVQLQAVASLASSSAASSTPGSKSKLLLSTLNSQKESLTSTSRSKLYRFLPRDVHKTYTLAAQSSAAASLPVADSPHQVSDKVLLRQIASVALPALAVCLVEPFLTLVDSYYIGSSSRTSPTALAALSINGAIFNVIAAITSPLCTGATALVARAFGRELRAQSTNEDNKSDQLTLESILLNGLFLAVFAGSLLTVVVNLFGKIILTKGFNMDVTSESYRQAWSYLWIRGMSLPFSLATYVTIGFSLGVQNIVTPVASISISSIVNILGDYIFVVMKKMGLVGAAVATSMATILATVTTSTMLVSRYIPYRTDRNLFQNIQIWCQKVDIRVLQAFFSTSLLLFIGSFTNTLTYSSGTKTSIFLPPVKNAASLALTHVAAHQLVLQSWWFLSFFSSPLSLAAQSVLPKQLQSNNKKEAKRTIQLLAMIGTLLASVCTVAMYIMTKYFPTIFTSNGEVLALLPKVLPQAVLSMFVICITTMLDGVFIGIDAIGKYIAASFVSSGSAWLYYVFVAKARGLGVVGTWNGLLIFSLARFIFYLLAMPTTFRQRL